MVVAVVAAAAAAPFEKTAAARTTTMLPAATAVQAGDNLSLNLGGVIVSLTGLLLLWARISSVGCLLLLQLQRLEAIVYFLDPFFQFLIFLQQLT